MQEPVSIYKEKIDRTRLMLKNLQRLINFNALFRLLSFIGLVAAIYYSFTDFRMIYLIAGILFFALFIFWVRKSGKMSHQKSILNKLIFINENELAILQGRNSWFDAGEKFISSKGYSTDLDIFGYQSLYHLLNRTTTGDGSRRLVGMLSAPMTEKEKIEQYQQAVQLLTPQLENRQMLTAGGLMMEEKKTSLDSVAEWLNSPSRLSSQQWILVLRWLFPVYSLGAIYFFLLTNNISLLLAGFVAGWTIISIWSKYIGTQHQQIGKKQEILGQYTFILKTFAGIDSGSSPLLAELRNISAAANQSIMRLSTLTAFFDQSHNKLVALLLKPFFLYDIQCTLALEKWKSENKVNFSSWVKAVGDIECINSFSAFAFNNPAYTYALVEPDNMVIEARQMAHPMISAHDRVLNDFTIGKTDRLQLITGSNMSGKTTFLRAIGVNMVLAQCGAPVCASFFKFKPMSILTSIRISDSLQEHTSYFMAELKKLHEIVLNLEQGTPSLVLIDEILRGTNSEDKTHGSDQFIRKLIQQDCLSLFATHDLALSKLSAEWPGTIGNFCFESIIRNDELYFDYKLQAGVAKNKNASFLMKKMGIVE